jgi:hypothetical protein
LLRFEKGGIELFRKKNEEEQRNFEFGNFELRILDFVTAKTQSTQSDQILRYGFEMGRRRGAGSKRGVEAAAAPGTSSL